MIIQYKYDSLQGLPGTSGPPGENGKPGEPVSCMSRFQNSEAKRINSNHL